MEFNYRAIDERPSTCTHQSSNYGYFTEQALRGYPVGPGHSGPGYPVGPGHSGPGYPVGPGHSGPGYPVGASHSEPGYPVGAGHSGLGYPLGAGHSGPRYPVGPSNSGPGFGHPNEYYRNPIEMHEAIWRELEKEKIREEIIMEEIVRRRILEAEVRRELMIERELAMRRGGEGFFFPSILNAMRFEPGGLPALPLPYRSEGSSLEGRMSMSLEERLAMSAILRREFGGFDSTPFEPQTNSEPRISEVKPASEIDKEKEKIVFVPQRSSEPRISEVKPASEIGKEKEKIVFVAKPGANLCGAKRKAETLPLVDSNELPSAGASKKKVREEWSCALCMVCARTEHDLNGHLRGKRHKAKEAGLRKNGKNFSIGLYPKNTAKPNKHSDIANKPSPEQGMIIVVESDKVGCTSLQKETNSESAKGNSVPLLTKNQQPDDSLKNNEGTVQRKKKTKKHKKEEFTFWCELCQVGAKFQKGFEQHMTGKKHMAMLQKANRKSGAEPSTPIVQATQELNLAGDASKDGENTVSENADGIVGGIELEAHQKQEAYANTVRKYQSSDAGNGSYYGF